MKTLIVTYVFALAGRGVPTFDLRRQEGQALAEYALIIALIATAVIVALTFMYGKIGSLFSEVGNKF